MSKRAITNLIKYAAAVLTVALFVMSYLQSNPVAGESLVNQYRILSDAFSIPGLLLIFFGLLIWVSNAGALDAIGYCLSTAITALIPGRRVLGFEKYGDYKERKRDKAIKGYSFLFVVGAATLAVSVVFVFLYESAYAM